MAPHLSWRGAPTCKKEVDCGRLGKSGGYYGRQAWNICHSYLNAAMNSYYQREKRRQKEEHVNRLIDKGTKRTTDKQAHTQLTYRLSYFLSEMYELN